MKVSIKTLLHNYLVTMARNYEGKRFWPSLTRSLLSAAISIVLTALVLPRAFSVQNLANQIWSGFFFFLCLNGGMKLFENIRENGFTARLIKVCKDIPSSFYGEDSSVKSILWAVFTIVIGCMAGSIFMPPLVSLALGLNLFFSVTMGPKSFILMVLDIIPKGNAYRKNRRGRMLALLGVAIFIGFIISVCVHKGIFVTAPGHEAGMNSEVSKGNSNHESEKINIEYGITGSELAASDSYLEIETEYSSTNQMTQKYTINDVPSVCRENEWFMSGIEGRDYLITDFSGGKIYTLWIYDEFGDVDAIRGMTVYKSKDELLKEHQGISDSYFDENGYMRKDNILYYEMPVNEVIAVSADRNKYTMLLYAAAKAFDEYFYYFSMPYNTVADKSDLDIDIVEAGKDYSDYTSNVYESVQNLSYGDSFYDKDSVYEENESGGTTVTVPDEEKGVGENFYQGDIYVEYIREYTAQEAKSINMYYVSTDVFFEKEDDTYTVIIDVHNPLDKKIKVNKIECLISDGTIYNDRTVDINVKINSESAARIYIPISNDAIEGLDRGSIDLYSYGIEMDD